MNKLTACLMLLWAALAHSGSLNPVMPVPANVQLGVTNPALTTEHLIYTRQDGENQRVWSHHLGDKTHIDLLIDNPTALISMGDLALVIAESANGPVNHDLFDVYRTDGTPEGTTLLHQLPDVYRLEMTDQAVFIIQDKNIHQFEGDQWTHHVMEVSPGINHLDEPDFCQLSDEHFMFLGRVGSSSLQVNSNFGLTLPLRCVAFECGISIGKIGNQCLISQVNENGYKSFQTLIKANLQPLDDIDRDLSQYRAFAELNGQLVGLWVAEQASEFSLHQLNPDTFEVISQSSHAFLSGFPFSSGYTPKLLSTADHLMVYYDRVYWFDQELVQLSSSGNNNIPGYYIHQNSGIFTGPSSTRITNGCPYYGWCGEDQPNPELIILDQPFQDRIYKSTFRQNMTAIEHNPLTDQTLLLITDLVSGQPGVYQWAEQPNMGRLANGIWYNPELPSQGLSINHGVRQNGSQYLFVSAYLFEQGQPLWLAGSVDVDGTDQNVTIELYRYEGPGLFEPGQTATQSAFATVQLEMPSCQALGVVLNVGQTEHTLTLYRADDVRPSPWCQD